MATVSDSASAHLHMYTRPPTRIAVFYVPKIVCLLSPTSLFPSVLRMTLQEIQTPCVCDDSCVTEQTFEPDHRDRLCVFRNTQFLLLPLVLAVKFLRPSEKQVFLLPLVLPRFFKFVSAGSHPFKFLELI